MSVESSTKMWLRLQEFTGVFSINNVFSQCLKTELYEEDMSRLTLAVTSLLWFLLYSVHASKPLQINIVKSILHASMGVLYYCCSSRSR